MLRTLVLFGTFEFFGGEAFVRDVVEARMVEGRSLSDIENKVEKEALEATGYDSYLIPALFRGEINWTWETLEDDGTRRGRTE
jgi:hypothetical protein